MKISFFYCNIFLLMFFVTMAKSQDKLRSLSNFFGPFENQLNLKIIKQFRTKHGRNIAFVDGSYGRKYVVKQYMKPEKSRQLSIAREKLGSCIAESCDILSNRVDIIPAGVIFLGKCDQKRPATLHEVVPGIEVQYLSTIHIHQEYKRTLPRNLCGLTWQIVENMALHPDLSKMVALDTFIGNHDRHRGNFFYDKASDHFFSIDLENSFGLDLAQSAHEFIELVIGDKNRYITQKELEGLSLYRDTLKELIIKNSPTTQCKMLYKFAVNTGLFSKFKKDFIIKYKKNIEKRYESSKRLVLALDQLIAQHANKKICNQINYYR